ncbi:MAG: hypothetical protein QF815_02865, partial [Candidatus Peribacteraceae bacterium]|nr:hypothetical protein [Candidatus Peribacteraceae bacterium]
ADILTLNGQLVGQVQSTCGDGYCDNRGGESAYGCDPYLDPSTGQAAGCDGHIFCPEDCDGDGNSWPCPTVDCAAPPSGCQYVNQEFKGDCKVSCGELVCEQQCVTVDCVAPSPGCKYVNQEFNGDCQVSCGDILCVEEPSTCGNNICDNGEKTECYCDSVPADQRHLCSAPCRIGTCPRDCEERQEHNCEPYDCVDANGNRPPRCSEDGHPINYFVDPCRSHQSAQYCNYNGREYKEGDRFKDSDDCNTCFCEKNGSVSCTEMVCVDNDDEGFRYAKWDCHDGSVFSEGDPTSCKSKATWLYYAYASCRNHCNTDQCLRSIRVEGECGGDDDQDHPPPPPPPPPPRPPHPSERKCHSSRDCPFDKLCSVEIGDCKSSCAPGAEVCTDVCVGICIPREMSNPDTLKKCESNDQCDSGFLCTSEIDDCFDGCPLEQVLCAEICSGRCIPDGDHSGGGQSGPPHPEDDWVDHN